MCVCIVDYYIILYTHHVKSCTAPLTYSKSTSLKSIHMHAYVTCTYYIYCLFIALSLKMKLRERDAVSTVLKQQLAMTVQVSTFAWVLYSHELCHTNAIIVVYHSLMIDA